jgi:acetyl coenzyme A synthetase (ADP forming)-like protein
MPEILTVRHTPCSAFRSMTPTNCDLHRADIVLRDGSTLLVRDAQPADEPALRTFHDRLSEESQYFRFFTVPKSSAAEVERLVHADPSHDVVLVGESGGRISAVASYTRNTRSPERAEVAFAIADALQGRGVGTRLLELLAEIARGRGLRTFDAYVLGDNTRMMKVFQDSGFVVERRLDSGVFHVTLSLDPVLAYRTRAAERAQAAATASIRSFFQPRSIVVIGANRERGKIGSEVLHNLTAGRFAGRLFAVHPNATIIDGVPAFPAVGAVPESVDLAVICVPAASVIAVVDECIKKGVKALVVISAGFGETGAAGRAMEAELLAKVRDAGIRLVGPNCMGLLTTDPAVRMNATFAPVDPPAGRVALSTQSGALGLAILDYARSLQIGFSTFVSIGNKADVSGNDLLQYWEQDPRTDVILLYVESFGNPRKFTQIARRVARKKPIVAVKAGRSKAGARAASSHTGALAASDAIVDALLHQAGVIRTRTLEELFDVAALVSNQPLPRGRRVAILTNAGGPGILAADACEAQGLEMPALSDRTVASLRSFLPAAASVANPVDMIASASAEHYERALTAVLDDDLVDAVLVIFIPPLVTKGDDVAQAIQRAATARADKTVLAIFMSAEPASALLAPVPSFRFPEAAATALARAADYGEWRRQPDGTAPEFHDVDRDRARAVVDRALERGGGWLTPDEARALLLSAGIPVAAQAVVASEAAAVDAANRIGYPVAMKAIGPEIIHKTEVGGIRLDLENAEAVRQAWHALTTRLGGSMTGVLVQAMVSGGVEMLVGAVEDPVFGPVLACATGGTMAELLADSQCRLYPLTDRDAAEMVAGLRGAALLRGHRGSPPADEAALRDALLRLSAIVGICPEIQELDINPLRVLTKGAVALDARVRVERPKPRPATRRVSY